jgi:hypothetical protein
MSLSRRKGAVQSDGTVSGAETLPVHGDGRMWRTQTAGPGYSAAIAVGRQ